MCGAVRNEVAIDGTLRENVRARLRVIVQRIFRKRGYSPEEPERTTQTALEQAGVLPLEWADA